MSGREIRDYKAFMHDATNAKKCDKCPANEGKAGNDRLPCGQYRCWVTCHCGGRR